MQCPACGAENESSVKVCSQCGSVIGEPTALEPTNAAPEATGPDTTGSKPAPEAPSLSTTLESLSSSPQVAEVTQQTRVGLTDGWAALKALAIDPVGQLTPVADDLGPERARAVGIVYAVVFSLALWLGSTLVLRSLFSGPLFGFYGQMLGATSAGTQFKLLIYGFVPYVGLVAASALARALLREPGRGIAGDLYYVGVSLLPFAVFLVLSGILGAAVPEVVFALVILALCFHILILFKGCSEIAGLGERRASFAVPLMLLVAGWISSVIIRSVL